MIRTEQQRARAVARVCSFALLGLSALPLLGWLFLGRGLRPVPQWGPFSTHHTTFFATIPYVLALVFMKKAQLSRRFIVTVGVVMGALLIIPPSINSRDIFSYLFYGKMLAHGHLNPLVAQPNVMASDPWYHVVGWRNQPSVYGPVWSYTTALVVLTTGLRFLPSLYIMKLLALGGLAGAAVYGPRIASSEDPGRRDWILAALIWNPLILFSLAGEGHIDGILLGLVVAALYFRLREKDMTVTVLLLVASLLKSYCFILLGLHLLDLVRRREMRTAVRAGAISLIATAASYAPLWEGTRTFAGMKALATQYTPTLPYALRGLIIRVVRGIGYDNVAKTAGNAGSRAAGVVVLLGVLAYLVLRKPDAPVAWRWSLAFGAYLVCTPWFLPWHALPLIGLGLVAPDADRGRRLRRSALVTTASAVVWIPLARFGPPIVALAWPDRAGTENGTETKLETIRLVHLTPTKLV